MKALITKLFTKKAAPAEAAEKQPKVKNALLQTYFTSLLSLVLCAAMFLGTSYAWFTSEVSNQTNEIYIGMLDVGLYMQSGSERKDLSDNANKLFDRSIRWEPGYTSLETVHVVNEGDLAFKYVLSFTDGKLAQTGGTQTTESEPQEQDVAKLHSVAKWFDVWVYNDAENAVPATAPNFDQLTAADAGWVKAGTLDQLLAGAPVFSGLMEAPEVRHQPQQTQPDQETIAVNANTTDGKATEKTYTVALHMQPGTDLAVMGQKITLNVKLVAYQLASEQDDLGAAYDRLVLNAAELTDALTKNGTVALAADIVLTEGITVPKDVSVSLDLNGHAISFNTTVAGAAISNNGTLTVFDSTGTNEGAINLVYAGLTAQSAGVYTIANRGKLTVNSGSITNTCATAGLQQIGYAIDNYNGSTLTVNGGKITASGSGYYDGIRLFCGKAETLVTINGGEISSVWAQNPSTGKAEEVKGTVVVNGGNTGTVFYERYTTVKVLDGVEVTVTPYGDGKGNTESNHNAETGYTTYNFDLG